MSANLNRLLAAFGGRGHPPQAGINRLQFFGVLDQLLVLTYATQGAQFDREVAGELWEQADIDGAGNAEVQQLCEIIEDAQNILVERRREINLTLQQLYARQRQLAQNSALAVEQRSGQLQLLNAQILQLERDLREYNEDLYLVSFPFGVDLGGSPMNAGPNPMQNSNLAGGYGGMMGNSQPITPVRDLMTSDRYSSGLQNGSLTSNPNMNILFWLTVLFGILEVVVMFEKYDFLNVRVLLLQLLVFVCILSIFLLNYFDKNYIVLCIALTGVSVLMDLIWLVVLGPKHWSPPTVGEFSMTQWGYLRIIFFFTILQLLVKVTGIITQVAIILLLLKQRNLPEAGFTIDMPKLTIFGNRRNPISQQVELVTGGRF